MSTDQDEEDLSDQEEQKTAQSYALLLKSLKPPNSHAERPRKRRKLGTEVSASTNQLEKPFGYVESTIDEHEIEDDPTAPTTELAEDGDDVTSSTDSDEESFILSDPFESHYSRISEQELVRALEHSKEKAITEKHNLQAGISKVRTSRRRRLAQQPHEKSNEHFNLKRRLLETGESCIRDLNTQELDLQREMFQYSDILSGNRTSQNASRIRELSCLHALNHIFKTRDRVLKNNAQISQAEDQQLDCRDQGFTRPKILILVPTKQI